MQTANNSPDQIESKFGFLWCPSPPIIKNSAKALQPCHPLGSSEEIVFRLRVVLQPEKKLSTTLYKVYGRYI